MYPHARTLYRPGDNFWLHRCIPGTWYMSDNARWIANVHWSCLPGYTVQYIGRGCSTLHNRFTSNKKFLDRRSRRSGTFVPSISVRPTVVYNPHIKNWGFPAIRGVVLSTILHEVVVHSKWIAICGHCPRRAKSKKSDAGCTLVLRSFAVDAIAVDGRCEGVTAEFRKIVNHDSREL